MIRRICIAVIGGDIDSFETRDEMMTVLPLCYELGQLLAENNYITLTGGDDGVGAKVMEGAISKNGITISFYPNLDQTIESSLVSIPIYTGMGYGMRDILMLRSADVVIAIGGGAGTLNEIANAYNMRKPIVALKGSGGWSEKLANTYLDKRKKVKIESVDSPTMIIQKVKELILRKKRVDELSKIVRDKDWAKSRGI